MVSVGINFIKHDVYLVSFKAGNFMAANFLAGNVLTHRITFGDFMVANFLAGDFLGGYRYTHLFTDYHPFHGSAI